MSLVKQLLLLKKQGFSNRKAAGMVGMDKEAVNNYVDSIGNKCTTFSGMKCASEKI